MVSSEHLNYAKYPVIRAVHCFHVCYHVRRILKRLQVPLAHETGFNAANNSYTESEFFKICRDYGVPNDPVNTMMKNFIALVSVVLFGLMTTLAKIQSPNGL